MDESQSVFLVLRKRELLDVFWNLEDALDRMEDELVCEMLEIWDIGRGNKSLIGDYLRPKYFVQEFTPKGFIHRNINSVALPSLAFNCFSISSH